MNLRMQTEYERQVSRQRAVSIGGATISAMAGIFAVFVVFAKTARGTDHSADLLNAGAFVLLGAIMPYISAKARNPYDTAAFKAGITAVVLGILLTFANTILVLTSTKDWIVATPGAGPYALIFLVYTGFATAVTSIVR